MNLNLIKHHSSCTGTITLKQLTEFFDIYSDLSRSIPPSVTVTFVQSHKVSRSSNSHNNWMTFIDCFLSFFLTIFGKLKCETVRSKLDYDALFKGSNWYLIIQSDSAEKWPNREQIALNANSTALGCLRV